MKKTILLVIVILFAALGPGCLEQTGENETENKTIQVIETYTVNVTYPVNMSYTVLKPFNVTKIEKIPFKYEIISTEIKRDYYKSEVEKSTVIEAVVKNTDGVGGNYRVICTLRPMLNELRWYSKIEDSYIRANRQKTFILSDGRDYGDYVDYSCEVIPENKTIYHHVIEYRNVTVNKTIYRTKEEERTRYKNISG